MAGGPPPRQLCKIDLPTAYPCQAGFAMLVGQIATLPVGDHLGEAGRDLDQAAMWTKRRTDWRWLCCTRCGRGEGAACRSLISPAADRLPMASSTEGPCRPGARRVITACRGMGNPESCFVLTAYYDVPYDEPELVGSICAVARA
jgi:hypothetical protein